MQTICEKVGPKRLLRNQNLTLEKLICLCTWNVNVQHLFCAISMGV